MKIKTHVRGGGKGAAGSPRGCAWSLCIR